MSAKILETVPSTMQICNMLLDGFVAKITSFFVSCFWEIVWGVINVGAWFHCVGVMYLVTGMGTGVSGVSWIFGVHLYRLAPIHV